MFNKQLGSMAIQELQSIVKAIQEMTPAKKQVICPTIICLYIHMYVS